MAGMNTIKLVEMIPKFDGEIFVEWSRSLNEKQQTARPFLREIIYGLERPEPIFSKSREGEGSNGDSDDNGSNLSDVSGHDSGSLNEEPQKSDIKAWGSATGYLFGVLRLTTPGAARSVLLKFDNGRPGGDRQAWLALKNKYQNTSRQRRRTLLRHLDNSVMRSDIDLDMFLSEVFQLCDKLSDLREAVSDERLTTIINNFRCASRRDVLHG